MPVATVPMHWAQWIERMPMPIMLLNRRGQTLSFNRAWQEAATPGGLMAPTDHRGGNHLRDLASGSGGVCAARRQFAAAILAVLAGQERCRVRYELEENLWDAVAQAVDDGPVQAMILHVDHAP